MMRLNFVAVGAVTAALAAMSVSAAASALWETQIDFERDFGRIARLNSVNANAGSTTGTANTIEKYTWDNETEKEDAQEFGTSLRINLLDNKNSEALFYMNDSAPIDTDIEVCYSIKRTDADKYKFCHTYRTDGTDYVLLTFLNGKISLLGTEVASYDTDKWYDIRLSTYISEGKAVLSVKEHTAALWQTFEADYEITPTQRISLGYRTSGASESNVYIDDLSVGKAPLLAEVTDYPPSYEGAELWADSLTLKNVGAVTNAKVNLYAADGEKTVKLIVGYFDKETDLLEEVAFDSLTATDSYGRHSIRYSAQNPTGTYQRLFLWDGFDSLKPVEVKDISPKTEYEKLVESITAMYAYSPKVLDKGEAEYIIPNNKSIMPIISDGEIEIPVSFFEKCTGKSVNPNSKTVDGIEYASLSEMCSLSDTYLFTHDNGIIIFSTENLSLSYENDKEILDRISKELLCTDVSGEDMVGALAAKEHPRLLFTDKTLQDIKLALSENEEIYRTIYSKLISDADSYLAEPVVEYNIPDGIRLIACSEEVLNRVLTLCIAYKLDNNEIYAKRAWDELYNISEVYADWNPYHFLDTGIMCSAAAIGYDMLNGYLSGEQKLILRNAIIEKGLEPAMEDFLNTKRSRSWDWLSADGNWRMVCCGGISMAALAIADDTTEGDYQLCADILENSLYYLKDTLAWFSPQGAYEEGIRYWDFGTQYLTMHMLSLTNSLGSDYGYFDFPGMRNSPQFITALNGSVSIFNYHDAGSARRSIPAQMMYFADRFDSSGDAAGRINIIQNGGANVFDMVFYKPKLKNGAAAAKKNIYFGNGIETAVIRTGFDEDDIYLGFHSDNTYSSGEHDHMDAGEFVLDMLGQNFFTELGGDNYNIANYHRDVYRFRAEGHNTIVINPDETPGQKYGASVKIDRHSFGENSSFAISDMTDAYSDNAERAVRGVRLDGQTVSVRDEVVMKKPSDFWWFAHTAAEDITISEDGKTANLTIGDKTLTARIQSGDGAGFSVMDAVPFPDTSPNPDGQEENTGIRKLCINVKDCESIDLCVSFYEKGKEYSTAALAPLSAW